MHFDRQAAKGKAQENCIGWKTTSYKWYTSAGNWWSQPLPCLLMVAVPRWCASSLVLVVASASTLEPRVDNHQLNNESIITLHVNSIDEPSLRARYTSFNFQTTKSFFLTHCHNWGVGSVQIVIWWMAHTGRIEARSRNC